MSNSIVPSARGARGHCTRRCSARQGTALSFTRGRRSKSSSLRRTRLCGVLEILIGDLILISNLKMWICFRPQAVIHSRSTFIWNIEVQSPLIKMYPENIILQNKDCIAQRIWKAHKPIICWSQTTARQVSSVRIRSRKSSINRLIQTTCIGSWQDGRILYSLSIHG